MYLPPSLPEVLEANFLHGWPLRGCTLDILLTLHTFISFTKYKAEHRKDMRLSGSGWYWYVAKDVRYLSCTSLLQVIESAQMFLCINGVKYSISMNLIILPAENNYYALFNAFLCLNILYECPCCYVKSCKCRNGLTWVSSFKRCICKQKIIFTLQYTKLFCYTGIDVNGMKAKN